MTTLRFGSATDIGLVRTNNQDRLLVAEPLFAVADGMGGHAAGEVASATAVGALQEAFTEHTPAGLSAAARAANRAVWDQAQSDAEMHGMGTTLVALALVGEAGSEELAVANVGDSRLYLFHDDALTQVTSDHSLVGELVAEGSITPAEAEVHPRRHVLTRALGVDPDVAVDLLTVVPRQGDRYLLCSDGLSREVTDDQVASILRRLEDPEEAAEELVSWAKAHGGNDNVTVVVVDVVDAAGAAEAVALVVPAAAEATDGQPTAAMQLGTLREATQPRWWTRRRHRKRAAPTTKLVTLRVVGFFGVLVALIAIAFGGIAFYARDSYYVGLQGSRLVIFKGRPGGVLWFNPTVAARPGVTKAGVLPVHLAQLRAGKVEGSLGDARLYVANLHREYLSAKAADAAPTTTTTTTTVPTTLPPTTLPATTLPADTLPVTGTAPLTIAPTTLPVTFSSNTLSGQPVGTAASSASP